MFTSLASQGVFALASSYGSLLARLVFQPIEESSRGVLGRLLPQKPSSKQIRSAEVYLRQVLQAYSLLSVLIVTVGPVLAPLLLRYVAGQRWTDTDAPKVLSLYCYYLPFLAINGILEAFVSAVATPEQIRRQSKWMFAFSAMYTGTGWLLLQVLDLGASGLIAANGVNMAARITWASSFVRRYLAERSTAPKVSTFLPQPSTIACSVLAWAILRQVEASFGGTWHDLIGGFGISALYGVVVYMPFLSVTQSPD